MVFRNNQSSSAKHAQPPKKANNPHKMTVPPKVAKRPVENGTANGDKSLKESQNGSAAPVIAKEGAKIQAVEPAIPVLTQQQINDMFDKELKRVYAEIDKYSDLQWAAKDDVDLVWRNGRSSTRSRINNDYREASKQWQNDTKASFGYAEITRVSLKSIKFYFVECKFI